MSHSQKRLRDLRDLEAEMRKTEFASDSERNFLMGLRNQLYPKLHFELLKRACSEVIWAKYD